jgi:hypothetical protein
MSDYKPFVIIDDPVNPRDVLTGKRASPSQRRRARKIMAIREALMGSVAYRTGIIEEREERHVPHRDEDIFERLQRELNG